jgi:hypothetical protein
VRVPARIALRVATVALLSCCVPARARAADGTAPLPGASPHATHQADEVMVHDHAPRHGGVVGMSGTRHVEVVLSAHAIRVYLSDLHRAPLSLDGVAGTATLRDAASPQTPRTVKLARRGAALEAPLPRLDGPSVDARVDLSTSAGPVLIEFTLPVAAAKP